MYETTVLSPEVLLNRAFWVRHFFLDVGQTAEERLLQSENSTSEIDELEVLKRLLELNMADIEDFDQHLIGTWDDDPWEEDDENPKPYSTLDLPISERHFWRVAFFGGEDPGTYHYLFGNDGQQIPLNRDGTGLLGWQDGHFQLPILRWPEVWPLAQVMRQRSKGLTDAQAYLLLAPLAYASTEGEAEDKRQRYAWALREIGLQEGHTLELAERMSGVVTAGIDVHQINANESSGDKPPFHWWNPDGQGWRCNSYYGFRRTGTTWEDTGGYLTFDAALEAAGVRTT